jgi:hypothetical protein
MDYGCLGNGMNVIQAGNVHPLEKNTGSDLRIVEYRDELHAEVLDDLQRGEYGYKYRIIDGVVLPPYVTPGRYYASRHIRTRPGDVCYVSFPKSGSTWLAYIIFLIIHKGDVPPDKTLRSYLHWVESSWTYPRARGELDAIPSPRIFKSHMPYHMALGGNPEENPCKYVYIARNPRDVAVSYYYFERGKSWAGNYSGPWEHWLKMFMEGKVQRGDWFNHVLSWWYHRDAGNILFLKYEDLIKNLSSEIKKLGGFLSYQLTSEVVDKIVRKTSFDEMKRTGFSNMHEIRGFEGFFREGRVGSWKEQFDASQNEEFNELYRERMKGSGLGFDFD